MIQFIIKGDYETIPENFKSKNGHYIAEFDELSNEQRKELKKLYPQGYFRLAVWERGGSDFEDGKARLVCGLDGEKLVPVVVRKKGWRANENHALFIGQKLCIVDIEHKKRDFNIILKLIEIKPKIGVLKEAVLWQGNKEAVSELPEEVEKFKEVLECSIKKVLEYRCTDAMYYLEN